MGGAAAPPMMIGKVMIQSGAKSRGGVMIEKSDEMMIEKSDDSMGQKNIKQQNSGGGISASAPRPHGTSEGSNTGKLRSKK